MIAMAAAVGIGATSEVRRRDQTTARSGHLNENGHHRHTGLRIQRAMTDVVQEARLSKAEAMIATNLDLDHHRPELTRRDETRVQGLLHQGRGGTPGLL